MTKKLTTTTVQSAIDEALASEWAVFVSGKHIVAVDAEGQPHYLGGGVEAPTWRLMIGVVPAPVA